MIFVPIERHYRRTQNHIPSVDRAESSERNEIPERVFLKASAHICLVLANYFDTTALVIRDMRRVRRHRLARQRQESRNSKSEIRDSK